MIKECTDDAFLLHTALTDKVMTTKCMTKCDQNEKNRKNLMISSTILFLKKDIAAESKVSVTKSMSKV